MNNWYQLMKSTVDMLEIYDTASAAVGGEFDGSDLAVELESQLGQLVVDGIGTPQGDLEEAMFKMTLPERIKWYKEHIDKHKWDLADKSLKDFTVAHWES